jgi:hypothetical protein
MLTITSIEGAILLKIVKNYELPFKKDCKGIETKVNCKIIGIIKYREMEIGGLRSKIIRRKFSQKKMLGSKEKEMI